MTDINGLGPVQQNRPDMNNIRDRKTEPDKGSVLSAPVDGFAPTAEKDTETVLTSADRLKIFTDKASINMANFTEIGTSALTGLTLCAGIGFAVAGGVFPALGGALIGTIGGLVAHRYGADKKIGKAVQILAGLPLLPVILTGKLIKAGVTKIADSIKKDKGSDDKAVKSEVTEKKSILRKIGESLGNPARIFKAIPKFIYPSITNLEPGQREQVEKTLDVLPLRMLTATETIDLKAPYCDDMGVSGLAQDMIFNKPVYLDKFSFSDTPGSFTYQQKTLIHEVGHTVDFSQTPIPYVGRNMLPPFGEGPYITNYASTNQAEDFAESFEAYHTSNANLREKCPIKASALDKLHEPTLYDKIMDHKEVRSAGKQASRLIDKVPHLRTSLCILKTVMSPIDINIGAGKLREGILNSDMTKKYEGKMDMARGLALQGSLSALPKSIGLAVARGIIDRKLKKGKMSIEKAEKMAERLLAFMSGPVGMTGITVKNEIADSKTLESAREMKYQRIKPKGFFKRIAHAYGANYLETRDAKTGEIIDKSLTKLTKAEKKKVAGAIIGGTGAGAVAGVAGWIGGGMAGAFIGSAVGGPLGGIIGAFVGKNVASMALSLGGAKLGSRALKFILGVKPD